MPTNQEQFRRLLKDKIEKSGLSYRKIAQQVGMNPSLFTHFFKGTRMLSAANLVKLAPLIGMKETEILEAAGLLSQSEETLKRKVFDPDYQPNEIDLEDLLRVGNVTMFGERLEEKDKEAILKIPRP